MVPIVSVCQQFQSDHTVNQTVTYHIHALIHNYGIFLSYKIVELKAASLFANALFSEINFLPCAWKIDVLVNFSIPILIGMK